MRRPLFYVLPGIVILTLACGPVSDLFRMFVGENPPVETLVEPATESGIFPDSIESPSPQPAGNFSFDVWDLWQDGPHLRGANLYQRRVYPELDGVDFLGEGPVGPPYTLSDLQTLASHGANLVNISHPGLYTETPPYELDEAVQANLDQLLDWALEADLFVVIAFRTGPGRSEFTFLLDDLGLWFDEQYLNDSVWQDEKAQAGWVEMWEYTAARYQEHPALVGYDLMVEPNANEVLFDEWDPLEYDSLAAGTLSDWNSFYPRIAAAIRKEDPQTPILVEPTGYGAVGWLPVFELAHVDRLVVSVHQYAPFPYTHQSAGVEILTFPGRFDTDWDGQADPFNRGWFDKLLAPLDQFKNESGLPMAVNEYGVQRWTPGAADFLEAELDAFERRGLNHAIWLWEVSYPQYAQEVTAFQLRLGPDPAVVEETGSSELLAVLEQYWARNTIRPSKTTQ
ncbi:MAG: cellulase family glycosylhydrolase [Anaerolineales bacterium]|nr:cellulase family glycosylhydrolase [Anaerolineales bacterium]